MDTIDTPDDMQELLLSHLKCYLLQQDPSQISIPESVVHIAQSQHQIGWSQLFQGRFSDAWRHHYQQCLGSKATNRKNGHTWVTTMITTIFTQWKELWQLRNQDKHGKDYKVQADAPAHRQAVMELINMYETKDQVLPHHAWIFKDPIHELQNKRTSYIRAIVANYKPMIEQAIQATAQESYQTRSETG